MDFKKTTSNLFLLFWYLKNRPWMWLVDRNLLSLQWFIQWYIMSLYSHDNEVLFEKYDSILSKFYQYIHLKLDWKFWVNFLWWQLILLEANNDQEKAFNLFFELFDEFKKEKGIEYEEVNP